MECGAMADIRVEMASGSHCCARREIESRAATAPRRAATAPAGRHDAIKVSGRSLLVVVLSSLIAFFPKCPVCWAAYMNIFGCVWLADTAVASWLLPALIGCSGLYLAMLLRRGRHRGYAPFWLSCSGMLAILVSRNVFADTRWLAAAGVLVVLSGSLLQLLSVAAAGRPSRV